MRYCANIDVEFEDEEQMQREMRRITDFICERTEGRYQGWGFTKEGDTKEGDE